MKFTQRTVDLISLASLFGAILIALTALNSCVPRAYPPGPNPLDFPGDAKAETAALHAKNIRWITRPQ